MKTFLTESVKKAGPNIEAGSWKSAQAKAARLGCGVIGELQYTTDRAGVVLEIGRGCKLPLTVGQPVQLPV